MIATQEPPVVAAAMRRLDRFRQADIERLAEWVELAKLGQDEKRQNKKMGQTPYGLLPGEDFTLGWIMRLRISGWQCGRQLMGFEQISSILNHRLIPTRCGGIWYRATVRAIIARVCPVLAIPQHRLRKLSDERLIAWADDVTAAAEKYR